MSSGEMMRLWGLLGSWVCAGSAWGCTAVQLMALNWPSAQLIAAVDEWILAEGFECSVSLVHGTTDSAGFRLAEEPAVIVPEYWRQDASIPGVAYFSEGPFVNAGAGIYAPHPWLEQYGSLERALIEEGDPKQPKIFWGCPADWPCHWPLRQWARAMDLSSLGWRFVEPSSGAEVALQQRQSDAWIGWGVGPDPALARLDLVVLPSQLPHDPEHYRSCYQNPGCAIPQPMSLPRSQVVSAVSGDWIQAHPDIEAYFGARRLSIEQTQRWLKYLDQGFDARTTALEFLSQEQDWWAWVPDSVAQRIKAQFNR